MVRKCCVPECKSDAQSVPSHRFPKDPHKRKIWLEAIKRTDLNSKFNKKFNNSLYL